MCMTSFRMAVCALNFDPVSLAQRDWIGPVL